MRAAEHGYAEAWLALGDLYAEGGPGVFQNIGRARECYQKADQKGEREVWYSLGGVYRSGRGGIAADWPRAYRYYLKAAEQGHPESQYIVGQFLEYGIGTTVDLSKSVQWYQKAAGQQYNWAEAKLGWLYEHGIGVTRDRQQALTWYKNSEKHGGYCRSDLERLGDAETLKRPPDDDEPVPITNDVEITLEPEKGEYELDDLVVIAVRYRNVGKETYSFEESHTGCFRMPFSVKDEKGRDLPNPYEYLGWVAGCFMSSIQILEPGKTLVIEKTLNQCVHFERPGTYTISTGLRLQRGKRGLSSDPKEQRVAEAKAIALKIRGNAPGKRQKDIDALVRAYREGKGFPDGMTRPAEHFGENVNILRRLVFYNEPTLLPFFLDALENDEGKECAETGLRVLPDRAAVLKTLEERLDHPEKYHTLDLLYPYLRLAGLTESIFDEPGRLDNWKREEEISRKCRDKAMQVLRDDTRYQYGYLVPGLLNSSNDLFLLDYVSHCPWNLDLVRSSAWALQRVKLGREHIPFLESLLKVQRDWAIADAAILQLVHLDSARYVPELKAHRENFSPEIVKLLLEPADD